MIYINSTQLLRKAVTFIFISLASISCWELESNDDVLKNIVIELLSSDETYIDHPKDVSTEDLIGMMGKNALITLFGDRMPDEKNYPQFRDIIGKQHHDDILNSTDDHYVSSSLLKIFYIINQQYQSIEKCYQLIFKRQDEPTRQSAADIFKTEEDLLFRLFTKTLLENGREFFNSAVNCLLHAQKSGSGNKDSSALHRTKKLKTADSNTDLVENSIQMRADVAHDEIFENSSFKDLEILDSFAYFYINFYNWFKKEMIDIILESPAGPERKHKIIFGLNLVGIYGYILPVQGPEKTTTFRDAVRKFVIPNAIADTEL
ncbi:MAG: hypothetical protein QS748_00060 [Candidatus Endonucleobacter bathymodioli]|uniref:Uncharacterized protein n=1 Tax=Candidatus Endonucleibacter bathymodioli TaxID=539814 RepID=A0AA90NQT6_9GAMM|nr:hypothetical protein [Candidatus Endonucleobacter bathymodioli]